MKKKISSEHNQFTKFDRWSLKERRKKKNIIQSQYQSEST